MATSAQLAANRANASLSICQRFRHNLPQCAVRIVLHLALCVEDHPRPYRRILWRRTPLHHTT